MGILMPVLVLMGTSATAQNSYITESFPNTFNTNGGSLPGSSLSGSAGNWSAAISNNSAVLLVDDAPGSGTSNALRMGTTNSSGSNPRTATVTTPAFNLTTDYAPTPIRVSMNLRFVSLSNTSDISFSIQATRNGGSAWTTVYTRTAAELSGSYSTGQWYPVSVIVPDSFRTGNFALRIITNRSTGSSGMELWVDDIIIKDPTVPDFSGAYTETTNAGSGFAVGDVYRFPDVVTWPEPINAYITIEAMSNATINMFDNNDDGISQRFQPRIAPSPTTMTADREGYVQFGISFRKASNDSAVTLSSLRFRHFDVDGHTNGSGHFREMGSVRGEDTLYFNVPSELSGGGTFVSGGFTWKKILGSQTEHTSVSDDAGAYFTTVYAPTSSVHFRMGYQFVKGNGGNVTEDFREYGAEFGNFSLLSSIPVNLPVHLLSFSGNYSNGTAFLRWETESFASRFEVERSADGVSFARIGGVSADKSRSSRSIYTYSDPKPESERQYYRLKLYDENGRYEYSNTVLLAGRRTEQISFYPNPVSSGSMTLSFTAGSQGEALVRITDLSGRVQRQFPAAVSQGGNALVLPDVAQLPAGIYNLDISGAVQLSGKFSVVR